MKKIVLILFAFLLPAFVFSAETDDSAFAAGSLEGQEDAELSAAADISDPLAEDSVMDAEAELKDVKPKEKKNGLIFHAAFLKSVLTLMLDFPTIILPFPSL